MNMIEKFAATVDTLFQRHAEARADFFRHRLGLAHHVDSQLAAERLATDVGRRGVRQRADRVEGWVAPQL